MLAGIERLAEDRGLNVANAFIAPTETDFTGPISTLNKALAKPRTETGARTSSGAVLHAAEPTDHVSLRLAFGLWLTGSRPAEQADQRV